MTEDVLIVGGGLNGPALALALARAGMRVAVIDALPAAARADASFDGRAYALAAASCRMLRHLGLWDDLAPHAQPIAEVKVTDGRAGEGPSPFLLHFDSADLDDGAMGHVIEDRHLRAALARALPDAGVTVVDADAVTGQTIGPAQVTLALASGRTLAGALLVGADGRASGTAARAGIRRHGHAYGQTAVTCAVSHARPHGGIAHQFFMPSGPLAILPLTGLRCSVVWSESDARAAALMAMDEAAFLAALRPAFGSFLGDIALAGPRFAYPLGLTLAERLTAPRLALVGDAAHGMHPIAGQGLNAGLRDAAALAQVLAQAHRRGEDPGAPAVLDRYARWRRFDTASMALATDGFNRLFSNDNPALRLLRDLGMAAVGALPPLRRALQREAAGLTGDLPDLMR